MKKRKTIAVCKPAIMCLVIACLSLPRLAPAAGVELAVGAWSQSPAGTMSYNAQNVTDNLNLKDELGYGAETRVTGRINVHTPLYFPNVYLMATPMEFKGTGNIGVASFTFDGVRFNGNVPVSSKLKLDHYDLALYYGLPGLKIVTNEILNIDVGINVRFLDYDANVSGTDSVTGLAVSASKSGFLPVPMVYVGAQVKPVKILAIEAEGRGVAYGKDSYYDIIGRVKVKPYGPVFLAAGYRYEKIKFDESGFKTNADFQGPFGEAGLEF